MPFLFEFLAKIINYIYLSLYKKKNIIKKKEEELPKELIKTDYQNLFQK